MIDTIFTTVATPRVAPCEPVWFAEAMISDEWGALGEGPTRDEAISNLVDFLIEEGRPLANSVEILGEQEQPTQETHDSTP